MTALDVGRASA